MRRALATRRSAGPAWLILPATLFLAIVFFYPSLRFLSLSFVSPGSFRRLFATTVYMRVLVNTVEIAGSVALLCVALGYPLAFLLHATCC